MHFSGIIIAVITFFAIGLFHPIVIKSEYYFSCRIWPLFAVFGVVFVALSLFIENQILSATLGVIGCSCFWSIRELFEQRDRVKKGWFPANPKRKDRETRKDNTSDNALNENEEALNDR